MRQEDGKIVMCWHVESPTGITFDPELIRALWDAAKTVLEGGDVS
jgi:aspartate aminotransferase-like enzyme